MADRPSKFDNMTSKELRQRLAALLVKTTENIQEICEIMLEQHNRGELEPAARKGVLQWFAQIARRELHPSVVLFLGGEPHRVRAMIGLPIELQAKLADGATIAVAVIDNAGQIISEEKRIEQLTRRQFEQAIGDGQIRPFLAQRKILAGRHQPGARRSGVAINIRVDHATGEVVVGQLRLSAAELAVALGKLGFSVTRKNRPAPAEKPAQQLQA